MRVDLEGKTVVIVGASSGIGLASARAAAARSAKVVMLSRSQAKLDQAAGTIDGGDVQRFAMDMLDAAQVERVVGSLGKIHHLVLTAVADELGSRAPIQSLTNEQVERTFDKLRGFVNVTRAAAANLDTGGSVTLLTGASAVKPPAEGFTALAAASASILGFGKALALELAPVRVNVVLAGVVDTPIHAATRDATKVWAEKTLPTRRFGQADDIADAITFLQSNPYVTGSVLTIDGGLTAL
ncbi:MAG: SDR family oxidoreductase [Polyangiaceae bacterium]|nr:SDR family oxidoreductase [Polyangiaceae bacterium]